MSDRLTDGSIALDREKEQIVGEDATRFDHVQFSSSDESQQQFLSPEHQSYLLQRHGTTELVPLPSQDPSDPLNWPWWKVNLPIICFAFEMLTGT